MQLVAYVHFYSYLPMFTLWVPDSRVDHVYPVAEVSYKYLVLYHATSV